jgi:hypothetical protein
MISLVTSFASIQKSSLAFFRANLSKIATYYFLLCFPLHLPFFVYQNFFTHPHVYPVRFFSGDDVIYFAINTLLYSLSSSAIVNATLQLLKSENSNEPHTHSRPLGAVLATMLPVFFGCLLYNLLLFVGLRLFVVPGLYLLPALTIAPVFIVFEDCDAVAALRKSLLAVRWHWLTIFTLIIVLVIILGAYDVLFFKGSRNYVPYAYNQWYLSIPRLIGNIAIQFLLMYGTVNIGYIYVWLKSQSS